MPSLVSGAAVHAPWFVVAQSPSCPAVDRHASSRAPGAGSADDKWHVVSCRSHCATRQVRAGGGTRAFAAELSVCRSASDRSPHLCAVTVRRERYVPLRCPSTASPGRFSVCSVALRRSRQDLICTIYPHFSVAANTTYRAGGGEASPAFRYPNKHSKDMVNQVVTLTYIVGTIVSGVAFAMSIWLVLCLVCAGFAAALARSRGRSALGWFILGVFFGPFALLVVFFPAKEDLSFRTSRTARKSRAQLGYTDDRDP